MIHDVHVDNPMIVSSFVHLAHNHEGLIQIHVDIPGGSSVTTITRVPPLAQS